MKNRSIWNHMFICLIMYELCLSENRTENIKNETDQKGHTAEKKQRFVDFQICDDFFIILNYDIDS